VSLFVSFSLICSVSESGKNLKWSKTKDPHLSRFSRSFRRISTADPASLPLEKVDPSLSLILLWQREWVRERTLSLETTRLTRQAWDTKNTLRTSLPFVSHIQRTVLDSVRPWSTHSRSRSLCGILRYCTSRDTQSSEYHMTFQVVFLALNFYLNVQWT